MRAGGRLQILVVDDDEGVRRVLKRQIDRMGHSVSEATSGEAALERLRTGRYDLLCTDLGMPGMSGWELIERARAIDKDLATILVTGWGDQIEMEEARARGADAVLAKPFDTARLQEVIDELRAARAACLSDEHER
jgi:CheY-like chemotaxis protein